MTPASDKIITATKKALGNLQKEDAGSVFCYGHFNVIHPGHIRFLQYARSLGKHLTIAIIGDRRVGEGQRKHYFTELERANGLAAIQFVDRVIILDEVNLGDWVSKCCPAFLVLGKEYEKSQRPDLRSEIQIVESAGTKVVFHAGEIHYASSDLLHASMRDIELERRQLFLQACRRQNLTGQILTDRIKKFRQSKILVIGDSIVDQYVACDAVGMSAEAPVLVVKEIESREYVGGAAVVAAHVKALGAQCTFLSVAGQDEYSNVIIRDLEQQDVRVTLLKDESRPTTFKIRYMVDNQKLFRVSRLKEHTLPSAIEEEFITNIHQYAADADGILVSDFVYGVITPRVLDEIQKIAKMKNIKLFGDLQCSSQVGNVAKFEDFELLCPTEREARIALSNQQDGVEWIANTLIDRTRTKNLIIKLGAEGFITYSNKAADGFVNREHFPALISNPVDVAGAGDSLLAAIAVSMCSGGSFMESAAIGACMAALAVQTVGNIPVSYQKLEKFINTLENA
jgi:rfaE bifunctional protein kinase chain/domain